MKKILVSICSVLLVALFALSMTGCSKGEKIKKAYEKAGYTVSTATVKDDAGAKTALKVLGLSDDEIKDAENWEVISATKVSITDGGSALVLKLPSSGEVKNFLTVEKDDGSKDTAIYDKAKKDGKINGDCLLLAGVGDAKDIFKNA